MSPNLCTNLSAEYIRNSPPSPLPRNLYLGTSTWTFPGWRGVIYHGDYKSAKDFSHRCLEEYATIPWFRTACIDSLFYNPPSPTTLERYASQTPSDFSFVSKVWERITVICYPKHARYGQLAGQRNPDFLNAALFKDRILAAYTHPEVQKRAGPFVFQFAPFSQYVMAHDEFIQRLGEFLHKLPKDFEYAVEVRNTEALTPEYFRTLNSNKATHCFNHWNSMVSIKEQMVAAARAGGLTADFFVARLLTPLGVTYEAAEKLFQPYDQIRRVNPEMRNDVLSIAKRAVMTNKRAYITANNKAEGNSALTMASIGALISQVLPGQQ
ncbi:MAG: DUF72 domain-containing protein [Pseudomonadota bacterium]|jgi:uncharacterized protein YecE (DUF72 family)